MCVYLSLCGVSREAFESKGFGVTAAAKARFRALRAERLLWFRTGLLSNRPNRRAFAGVGRFTVNAQEKE
jgi:hypothetical protein